MSHRHLHPATASASSSLILSKLTNSSTLLFLHTRHIHARHLKLAPRRPGLFLCIKAVLAERPPSLPPAEHITSNPPTTSEAACALETQVVAGAVHDLHASSPLKLQYVNRKRPAAAGQNEMGTEDTDLESKWIHRVWVTTGSAAMVGMMVKAMEAAGTAEEKVGVVVAAVAAYIVADLATGVYHWGIDNYGNAETPIFGPQIDAFQGHHKRPWTITKRQFANNIHALARPATFALAPFLLLPSHAYVDSFLSVFLACVVYSQQFHAWAHAKKKDVPAIVSRLQDLGLLVPRKMHGAHHGPPYNVNYCIVSGLWNPLLDRLNIFATLEKFIFSACRVRPRSWAETSIDWLQDGAYFSDGTDVDDTSSRC